MKFDIRGVQQAQQANLALMMSLKPGGALDAAVQTGTIAAHRYAMAVTHVDTSALKSSHRILKEPLAGKVYIEQGVRNPRTGALTSVYGPVEHNRGGSHAFYEITVNRYGNNIASQAGAAYISKLP